MYSLYSNFHGISLIDEKKIECYLPDNQLLTDIDELMPELPIKLTNSDYLNLQSCPNNFTRTVYGNQIQIDKKKSNQDFAIAGRFDNNMVFSILADGVTNKTFFAQRGAQISCLAGYLVLKEFAQKVIEKNKLTAQMIVELKYILSEKINELLKQDKKLLCELDIQSKEVAKQYFNDNYYDDKSWYCNTLVMTFLSEVGGLVLYVGDGAVTLRKDNEIVCNIFSSPKSSILKNYIHLGMEPTEFQSRLIKMQGYYRIQVASATDGLDRTCQNLNMSLLDLKENDGLVLHQLLKYCESHTDKIDPNIDIDNYSFSFIELNK